MKKTMSLVILLFPSVACFAQNRAAEFESVIRSGNSAKAFEFVRNMFGVPAAKDPFLHFRERGIKKLISFYDHSDRRIEATSLIRFNQTREFWKNYSEEFTAGKWNYKNLYKTDSLAWLAANYSVTLIYAHEMGHYMSYNMVADFSYDYSCEEVVANECLAAFANAFNSSPGLSMHRQLFLSLAKQTYELIPDSNKTDFFLPMNTWCEPEPMSRFFKYFESDEMRFLRLYGYAQFRMMESALVHYNGASWPAFLNNTFLDFYNTYTGAEHFKPLRYKIISAKEYKNVPEQKAYPDLVKTDSGDFFRSFFLDYQKYHFDSWGQLLESRILKRNITDPKGVESPGLFSYSLINSVRGDTASQQLHQFVYRDSVNNYYDSTRTFNQSFEIISAFRQDSNFYYLVKDYKSIYTDDLLIDTFFTRYQVVRLSNVNGKYYFRYFYLPDSLARNGRMTRQEIFLTGTNAGNTVIITNELTRAHEQIISMYPLDLESDELSPPIWQAKAPKKGYFNMLYPTLYPDEANRALNICFWNPITSKIYLIKIADKGAESSELYHTSFRGSYGPEMRVAALRLVAPNKLYVFAKTREPGNSSKVITQKLLLQW